MFKSIFRHIFTAYFAVCLAAVALTGLLIVKTADFIFYRQAISELKSKASLTLEFATNYYFRQEYSILDSVAKESGKGSGTRITFIDIKGRVVGDTDSDPAKMENHSDRIEFKEAMKGKIWTSVRYSTTVKQKMLSISIPVKAGSEILGVVRVSSYFRDINRTLLKIKITGLVIVIIIVICTGIGIYLISRRMMSSLAEIKLNIAKLAQNNPILEYSLPSFKELQGVVKTMNKVSRQITEKNSETANKLEELTEVFDSIKIGIILILQEERIARINRAACKILNIGLLNPVGKTVQEVIVDGNLQHFISSALQSILPLEDEIIIWKSNISLQIYSAPLNNSQGEKIGILVVLNDISYMRKLENVRKDFVANVSHELRTPITAIKGFIETLLENRIEDKEEIHRFLNIINKHTNRLNNIIDDLMLLAKMEAGENAIPLTTENLYEILKGVVEKCQDKALAKNISLELQGPRELNLRINPTLIEQAVVNLIDNAVKFSNDNSKVEIKVEPAEKELVISVKDYGIGIDPEHLPRLFERFYRVDRSRSRMEGGTGLGLSIVKHIALTHKGEVSVSSIPGEGSEFRIHLPR